MLNTEIQANRRSTFYI